jgi:hypothetical protein
LVGENPPTDPEARLEVAVAALARLTVDGEAEYRTMLRLSLEPGMPEPLLLRQGRAIAWLEDALSPLRGVLPDRRLRRLALAIRSACGIEALVWLTDVGGLSRKEAAELMRWSAKALFQAALAENPSARS